MRIVRYRHESGSGYGILAGERIAPVKDPFTWGAPGAPVYRPEPVGAGDLELAAVQLLTPCRPSKIVCIGVNYHAHAAEMGKAAPAEPMIFLKSPSAILNHGGTILRPPDSERVDHEAELGVVIGRPCRHVPAGRAREVIFGYTCVNDVTARDLQRAHGQWFKGKSLDGCCPIGPCIVTADELPDPYSLRITCHVNGELRQDSANETMTFDIPTLINHLSRGMSLLPGDIIATGTPSGVGFAMKPPVFLRPGDVVECAIEGIGAIRNRVAIV